MTTPKKPLSRRQMLTATGLTLGGGLLAAHAPQGQAEENNQSVDQPASSSTNSQPPSNSLLSGNDQMVHYTPISSKEAAKLTYEVFPEGSCMYAVVKGIVSLVAEKKQSTISPLFYNMFKYGHGGVAGFGSLCGACNGAAAVMGLFCGDKKTCDKMITELFRWYETTELPIFVPPKSSTTNFPQSIAGSILCHPSTSQWARAAKTTVFSPMRSERCKRLAADVAKKTVEILNAQYAADKESMSSNPTECQPIQQMGPPDSCIACHSTPGGRPGSYRASAPKTKVKMDCNKCHYMPPGHPEGMGQLTPQNLDAQTGLAKAANISK